MHVCAIRGRTKFEGTLIGLPLKVSQRAEALSGGRPGSPDVSQVLLFHRLDPYYASGLSPSFSVTPMRITHMQNSNHIAAKPAENDAPAILLSKPSPLPPPPQPPAITRGPPPPPPPVQPVQYARNLFTSRIESNLDALYAFLTNPLMQMQYSNPFAAYFSIPEYIMLQNHPPTEYMT